MENISESYSWIDRVHKRFKDTGKLIPDTQRDIYKKIASWCGGRVVFDVGCGLGIGSGILGERARFVGGLDVNGDNIKFAKEAYDRDNLEFYPFDIEHPETREWSEAEVIVCVEVIEHISDLPTAMHTIKRFFGKNAVGFITIPNIANSEIKERDDKNELHLNHWNAGTFYEFLIEHFASVTLFANDKLKEWGIDETVDGNSTAPIIIAKVEGPKNV